MKKIQKYVMMFLIGAVSLGFTACSDNNDNNEDDTTVTIENSAMQAVADTYVKDVVYPTYQALAANAQTLLEKSQTLYRAAVAGNMQQSQIDEACEAFKAARREWERSEAFLYGSATNNELDPHIDSWPLDQDMLVEVLNNKTLVDGFKSDDAAHFVSQNNGVDNGKFQSVLGFHGMEFVLFRNGANRTVEDFKKNETFEGMESVKGIDELAFLQAVAGDVRNVTALLEYTWMGDAATTAVKNLVFGDGKYLFDNLPTEHGLAKGTTCWGEYLLNPGQGTGFSSTWLGTISQIFIGGCSNISNEVQEQKLGQAYRVATGHGGTTEDGEDESIDYIESPYSHRSFVDYKDNIYSIQNSLYGTRDITATPVQNSIMTLLKNAGYPDYAALSSSLAAALKSFDDATAAQGSFVAKPGSEAVKNCIDAVKKLDDELNNAGNWIVKQNAK